jgi:hypothetical protein
MALILSTLVSRRLVFLIRFANKGELGTGTGEIDSYFRLLYRTVTDGTTDSFHK